jgi:hypothetical protein
MERFGWEMQEKRDHLEELDANGILILKGMLWKSVEGRGLH